jgi:hypothetical protein
MVTALHSSALVLLAACDSTRLARSLSWARGRRTDHAAAMYVPVAMPAYLWPLHVRHTCDACVAMV